MNTNPHLDTPRFRCRSLAILLLICLGIYTHAEPALNGWRLDPGFRPNINLDYGQTIVEQPDGKILVALRISEDTSGAPSPIGIWIPEPGKIVRLHPDGKQDKSFSATTSDMIHALRVQPDGRVLISGYFELVNDSIRPLVARLMPNGTLDTSFAPPEELGVYNVLEILPDRRLLALCSSNVSPGGICRLHADGSLDTSFRISPEEVGVRRVLSSTLAKDGKIFLAYEPEGFYDRFNIMRLNADGSRDLAFEISSFVTPNYNSTQLTLRAKVNGSLLLRGFSSSIWSYAFYRDLHSVKSDGTSNVIFSNSNSGNRLGSFAPLADGTLLLDYPYDEPTVLQISGSGTRRYALPSFYSAGPLAFLPLSDGHLLLYGQEDIPRTTLTRFFFKRYKSAEPAVQHLRQEGLSRVIWQRTGTLADLNWVTFESWQIDHWEPLGSATLTENEWTLSGLSLPAAGKIRATGQTSVQSLSRGLLQQELSYSTPPTLTAQPSDAQVPAGGAVTFSVTAVGPGTLTYQWRFNEKPLPNKTSPVLSLSAVQTAQLGLYDVVVRNAGGVVISRAARLSILPAVNIANFPESDEIAPGETAQFNVSASGATGFQWLRDGRQIPGATGASLSIANADASHAGFYSVTVTSPSGKVTTPAVQLRVRDSALLLYKMTGTGTAFEGTDSTQGAVSGILVLDRANQRGGLIWFWGKSKPLRYHTELHEDLHTHSTGPIPKSQTVITELSQTEGPQQEQSALWLRGTDSLIILSATDKTVAPKTASGSLASLQLTNSTRIESIFLNLALDIPNCVRSRLASETVEETLERLTADLRAQGWAPMD